MNNQFRRGGRCQNYQGRGRFGGGGRWNGRGGGRGGRRDNNFIDNRNYGFGRGPVTRNNGRSGDHVHYIESSGSSTSTSFTVAVQGCSHGELDSIYEALTTYESQELHAKNPEKSGKIDILICCGDVQTLRNPADFHALNVPPKYKTMGDFHAYYSGRKVAPILTIMIGGNHESSNYLQELYYGGWVAPNIWYMGAAGVINVCKNIDTGEKSRKIATLRIAGLSGIYNSHHYSLGRFETPPYDKGSLRSVYHIRHVDVQRLKALESTKSINHQKSDASSNVNRTIDIMVSHDWPRGIAYHGNKSQLLQRKPFFREEVESNTLGNPANEMLLHKLRPRYWFAAHLHVKFEATVKHGNAEKSLTDHNIDSTATPTLASGPSKSTTKFHGLESNEGMCPNSSNIETLTEQMTRFLSLDKCLPKRRHIQVLHIEASAIEQAEKSGFSYDKQTTPWLQYDPYWLSVLRRTHNWSQKSHSKIHIPEQEFVHNPVNSDEIEDIISRFQRALEKTNFSDEKSTANPMAIPQNFAVTAPFYDSFNKEQTYYPPLPMCGNPQTDEFLKIMGLDHRITVPYTPLAVPLPSPELPKFLQGRSNSGPGLHKHDVVDDNEIELDDEEDPKGIDFTGKKEKMEGNNECLDDPAEINLADLDKDSDDEGGDKVCFSPSGTNLEKDEPRVKKLRVENNA